MIQILSYGSQPRLRLVAPLEDAAVKLRRLGAYIERGQPARLLAGALEAVERAAVEVGLRSAQ